MIVRVSRAARVFGFGAVVFAFAACSDDPETGPSVEVRKFCQDLFASPAFTCCSDADRQERQFAVRYRYASADDCASQISQALGASEGRQRFDGRAASSCLSHLSSRQCGVTPTAEVRRAEDEAGCNRILVGLQDEGQQCVKSEDCKLGLVCPPSKDTGTSSCVKPAAINQGCAGPSTSVDHPPCEQGLTCAFFQQNPECLSPPCLEYRCVPFAEEGEPCTGLECAEGLSCREGVCSKEGPAPEGKACRILEHCAEGLYCDPDSGRCAPRKDAGGSCRNNGNAIFECKGICKQTSDGPGTCASFCGSQ